MSAAGTLGARAARFVRAMIHLAWTHSAWGKIAGRALFMLAGLLALAWVGRTATAAGPEPPVHADAMSIDGGAAASGSASAAGSAPEATPQAPASPPSPSGVGHARATADDPVYINHAGAEELRRLPGVGPKRAEAILALRQRIGRFRRVEDLLRVRGVGRRTVRKWRPLLRLDAPDAGAP